MCIAHLDRRASCMLSSFPYIFDLYTRGAKKALTGLGICRCAALTQPTACSNGFCPYPPNSFTYCGCPQLFQVNVRNKPTLTDLSYYSCLTSIVDDDIQSSLFLGNLSSLSSFNGLQASNTSTNVYTLKVPLLTQGLRERAGLSHSQQLSQLRVPISQYMITYSQESMHVISVA